MERRIIINYDSSVEDGMAITLVKDVIGMGKTSGGLGKNRKQYCHLTIYTMKNEKYEVYCPHRYKQKSERFDIRIINKR